MSLKSNQFIVIMAGGVGSRFWPASREKSPKQFLDITGSGISLLQQTFQRVVKIVPAENVFVLSVESYKDKILEQLGDISEAQLLLEPSRNNTAPCIAYAALRLRTMSTKAVFAVVPSDHIIEKEDVFITHMKLALRHASDNDDIVTLGITPTRPDTGYGYIKYRQNPVNRAICDVEKFVEKPDLKTAEQYLSSGEYLWNAGIFIWSVRTLIKAYEKYAGDILSTLLAEPDVIGTDGEQEYIRKVYPGTRKISVDFAIIENADNVKTIPSDIGWSDLGTWNSLYNYLPKDDSGNVLLSKYKKVITSKGNLVSSTNSDKLIVLKDLDNFIVIDTGDVLMIYPREKEQEIKQLRAGIKDVKFL